MIPDKGIFLTVDAISKSAIHRSLATPTSASAMARYKNSAAADPRSALDLVRSLVQKDINEKVRGLFRDYIEDFFGPAVKNAAKNVGEENAGADLLERVCVDALEHAKGVFKVECREIYRRDKPFVKRKMFEEPLKKRKKKKRKLGDDFEGVTKGVKNDTLFVTASKVAEALGFGQDVEKVFSKHPELLRYEVSEMDKESIATSLDFAAGEKVYLTTLSEVEEFAGLSEYAASDLRASAFTLPAFMVDKIKSITDLKKEEEKVVTSVFTPNPELSEPPPSSYRDLNEDVQDILNEIKEEAAPNNDEEDDLEFLHGMNLNSLVREFEMEADAGSQHLGILSLADDAESFPELTSTVQENIESLDNIEFH